MGKDKARLDGGDGGARPEGSRPHPDMPANDDPGFEPKKRLRMAEATNDRAGELPPGSDRELVAVADPLTGEVISYPAPEAVLAMIRHAFELCAQAASSAQLLRAETLAKLARDLAKLIGASVRTANEALRAQWHARLLLLERYEQAQAAGEVQTAGGDRRSTIVSRGNNDQPTTDELGLSRKKLSEARKVARAGGLSFADAVIRQASEAGVEGTSALLVRTASGALSAKAQESLVEVEPPEDEYDVIVIDPPWPMQKIERDVRPHQAGFDYPTMDEEELQEFPVPDMAAEDCHLFLWTTHKFLPMALRLAEEWGFRYVCTFVWHKPGGFQPIGLPQYNCRKGSPAFVDTKAFPTCFEAARREHSRKPDEFYETIARVTAGRRIEVFAREPRPGFELFGNETARFAPEAAA
jgi:N6-adenosine-specific RNA methylase IME4